MKFKFYIFGVPQIFDLYHGNAEELSYFQQFYDEGNKEDTKLTIHRKANGEVSYLYLKHNMITSEDRTNSFLGMSVVFDNEYVADVESLYLLFDEVYKTILQNKILLQKVEGNPNIQAKFLVRLFAEAEGEVQRIKNIIDKNLTSEFAEDVHPLDSSFKHGKANLVRKMNDKKSNDNILAALRTYTWVSLSPEYKDDIDNLDDEWKQKKKDNVKKIKDDIISLYNQLVTGNITIVNENIQKLDNTINSTVITIKQYIKNQPELKRLQEKYVEVEKQLNDLKKAVPKQPLPNNPDMPEEDDTITIIEDGCEKELTIDEALEKMSNYLNDKNYTGVIVLYSGIITSRIATNEQKADADKLKEQANAELNGGSKFSWKTLGDLRKKIPNWFYAIIGAVIIGAVLWFAKSDKSSVFPDTEQYLTLVNSGDSLLALTPPKYDAAIIKYKEADELIVAKNQATSKIAEANKIAIEDLKKQAGVAFDNSISKTKKIDCYNDAVTILRKAVKYGGNLDSEITHYKSETISYYTTEIGNTTDSKKEKEYANYILSIDTANEFANNLLVAIAAKDKVKDDAEKKRQETKEKTDTSSPKTTSAECLVTYKGQTKSGSNWIAILTQELAKRQSYDYVIGACTLIINNCPDLSSEATKLRDRAKAKKDNQ